MQYTPEHLDEVSDWIGELDEAAQEQLIDDFDARQPDILGYVMSEDAAMLGDAEAEMLLFVATVFWKAAERVKGEKMPAIAAETLDRLQDQNWQLFDEQERGKNTPMEEFVDAIIEAYAEPELLYYILDVFEEDEEGNDEFAIDDAAKVPMFVMLKTIADALIAA
jgi:hypothetical protein